MVHAVEYKQRLKSLAWVYPLPITQYPFTTRTLLILEAQLSDPRGVRAQTPGLGMHVLKVPLCVRIKPAFSLEKRKSLQWRLKCFNYIHRVRMKFFEKRLNELMNTMKKGLYCKEEETLTHQVRMFGFACFLKPQTLGWHEQLTSQSWTVAQGSCRFSWKANEYGLQVHQKLKPRVISMNLLSPKWSSLIIKIVLSRIQRVWSATSIANRFITFCHVSDIYRSSSSQKMKIHHWKHQCHPPPQCAPLPCSET